MPQMSADDVQAHGEVDWAANGVRYRIGELERRVKQIEDVKPDVLAERVNVLSEDVRSLRRAFYTFAFSVVASSIVFAFTVFSLLHK